MSVNRSSFNSSQIQVRLGLRRAQERLRKAQEPATSGLRINSLSDDSSVIARVFSLRNSASQTEQYQRNLTLAKSSLTFVDSHLSQVGEILQKVREMGVSANNGSLSVGTLDQIATQIRSLKDELLNQANTKVNNQYIFAGTKTSTQPFSGDPEVFNGNTNSMSLQVTDTLQLPVNINGYATFMGSSRTATGTDLLTSLKDSEGISLGVNVGDTITIAGTLGTAFSTTYTVTSSSTLANLASAVQTALRAATGSSSTETAAVTAGGAIQVTSGTAAITGLTLSISGNSAFNTANTFTTPITAGGGTGTTDTFQYSDGENVFDVLNDLADSVGSGDTSIITQHMIRLDSALDQINGARATVGTRLQQVDVTSGFLDDTRTQILSSLSDAQDADLTSALTELTTRQTAMQIIFASSSRFLQAINGVSLT